MTTYACSRCGISSTFYSTSCPSGCNREMKEIEEASETVPCEMCNTQTRMTGTKRCDNCWEIETRIRDIDYEVLVKILHTRFSHVYLHTTTK